MKTIKSETVEQFLKRGGVVTVCRSHRAHNAAAPTKIKSYATSSIRPKCSECIGASRIHRPCSSGSLYSHAFILLVSDAESKNYFRV